MYPPKEKAARLLAVGEPIKDVAEAVKRSESVVKLWLLEEDFCNILRDHAAGGALRVIVSFMNGEHADKDRAMVALALLRMNKALVPLKENSRKRDSEDETDIDEFSEDQLKRLEGGE